MQIKKNNFVEIEYLARLQDNNLVFDLTNEEQAKIHGLFDSKRKYKPIVVCIGKQDVIKGLDKELEGKEPGKSYTFTLSPEDAFGKKRTDLIKLVPTSIFRKQKINPMPGLQVNLDNIMGVVKTVAGGRTLVDFNHPLSGKTILYEVKILKIITDPKEKLQGMLSHLLAEFSLELNEGNAVIKSRLKEDTFKKELEKEILSRIPEIKSVNFNTL